MCAEIPYAMWNVIGHQTTIEILKRAAAADRVPHALLLAGPAGSGKTHLARELARALNCVGEDHPCGNCVHCRQIDSGSHPDVTTIQSADGKENIAIQQIRELREGASLRAFQGSHKVYIIAGAETLTAQAADALLKTLEEPQPQVTIILTANDRDALPATILSRCRTILVPPVDVDVLSAALRERGADADTSKRLARLAQGNVGWALQAVQQPKIAAQQEEIVSRLSEIFSAGLDRRLDLAEQLAGDRKNRASVRRSLEVLLLLSRDLLLVSQGRPSQFATGDLEQRLVRQAEQLTLVQIHAALERIRIAMARIDRNVDPRLTLEALFVGLP